MRAEKCVCNLPKVAKDLLVTNDIKQYKNMEIKDCAKSIK